MIVQRANTRFQDMQRGDVSKIVFPFPLTLAKVCKLRAFTDRCEDQTWMSNVIAMQCNAMQYIQHFSNSTEAVIVAATAHSEQSRIEWVWAWNVLNIVLNWNLRMNTFHMSTNNSWKWEDFRWMRTMAQWRAHVFLFAKCASESFFLRKWLLSNEIRLTCSFLDGICALCIPHKNVAFQCFGK